MSNNNQTLTLNTRPTAFNVPMLLTWLRIVLIPLFVGIYYLPDAWLDMPAKNLVATGVFGLAAITDWFDGYLARKWKQTSSFGAFLDPVADKLMVAAALILLVNLNRADALLAIIIIGREITISALREWMATIGARSSLAVAYVGKVKTTVQMIAIFLLLYADAIVPGINTLHIGTLCLFAAAVLTLWSMGYYLRMALPYLK